MSEEEKEEEILINKAKILQNKQKFRNLEEFGMDSSNVRLSHEGYRQGLYVRITITNVSANFIHNYNNMSNNNLPIILG